MLSPHEKQELTAWLDAHPISNSTLQTRTFKIDIVLDMLRQATSSLNGHTKLLDLGCGSGGFPEIITKSGLVNEVVGITASNVEFSNCLKLKTDNLSFKFDYIENIDETTKVDVVLLADVLQMLKCPNGVLSVISKITKSLILTVPSVRWKEEHRDKFGHLHDFSDIHKLIAMLKDSNFIPERVYSQQGWHFLLLTTSYLQKDKKIKNRRVLDYRWHVPHQYELLKLKNTEFDFYCRRLSEPWPLWDYGLRLQPKSLRRPLYFEEINPRKMQEYDFIILHLDEVEIHNRKGILNEMMYLAKNYNLPCISIMHGFPSEDHTFEDVTRLEDIVMGLPKNYIVFNSEAQRDVWGFSDMPVILHGIDPDEWSIEKDEKLLSSQPLTCIRGMAKKPKYYGKDIFDEVNIKLNAKIALHERVEGFDNYKQLFKKHYIYFHPGRKSSMPRSRTEALLSGCYVVSTGFVGEVEIFKDIPGTFISNNPNELYEYLLFLIENPEIAINEGKKAREEAIKVFSISRFLQDWEELIHCKNF